MKSSNSINTMLTCLMLTLPAHHAIAIELDAHEHGSANLDIVIDTDTIQMSFHSPAVNIVGFEYATDDKQQLLLIKQAKDSLSNVNDMFSLVGNVSCQTVKASANWLTEHEEEHDDHEEEHDDHEGHEEEHDDHEGHEEEHDETPSSEHAEFIAEYELTCKQLNNLTAIEVNLFEFFPAIADLDVQMIYAGGQVKQELNANNTLIELAY
ncbi:DUF2796 domain-containing protein [Oceanospirillaceae bacterium]|nr:DUF2796 domain-containing protein [Oceanospirillaceae bacterium]